MAASVATARLASRGPVLAFKSADAVPPVRDAWRLAVAVTVAVAIHLGLLFGVEVAIPEPTQAAAAVNIRLATSRMAPPLQPIDVAVEPVAARSLGAVEPVPVPTVVQAVQPEPVAERPPPSRTEPRVAPVLSAAEAVRDAGDPATPVARRVGVSPWNHLALADDIVALARDTGANTPEQPAERTYRWQTGANVRSDFAAYLEAWRRKVERIGNINYPSEARANALSGSLRLLVTITQDGALRHVRIIEPSGHAVLDTAALRIVRLAAPYAPFSPSMRARADVLEIERTWHFRTRRGGFTG